jgi:hypothetical protein
MFVGAGYASVSEKQMMKDILRNGPTSGDLMAGELFKVYDSGILSEKQSKSFQQKIHKKKHLIKKKVIVDSTLLETCEIENDFEFRISISEKADEPKPTMVETKSQLSERTMEQ